MQNLNWEEVLRGKKAIFVDCDGTLADTMPAHKLAYKLAFAANHVPFDSDLFDEFSGYGAETLMREMISSSRDYEPGVIEKINKDKQALLGFALKKSMRKNKKLCEFIRLNHQAGFVVQVWVVTNGKYGSINQILEKLDILWKVTGVIASDTVVRKKPYPDPYLRALETSKLKPHEIVVFEDNEIGILSAKAAGITDIVEVKTNEF